MAFIPAHTPQDIWDKIGENGPSRYFLRIFWQNPVVRSAKLLECRGS